MTPSNPYPDRGNTDSMSDDAQNGTSKQKFEEDARDAKREAGAQARERAEDGQHRIADEPDA